MSTKKDLVEAHAFSRRRLVTAFVSGAPGGLEVEPTRPGRTLIGGVALTVLLLAGAAIAGFLLGRPPSGWLDKGSFIISKDTGEQYVVLREREDPVIQRVPNYVSAQLLLGEADLQPNTVKDKYIREVTLGADLGIEGAPAGLPGPDDLIDGGWTACTTDRGGTKVDVSRSPQVRPIRDAGFLVRTGKRDRWLIATAPDVERRDGRAHRYRLPDDATEAGTLVDALGFGSAEEARVVDEEWLNLFPLGAPLVEAEFGVTKVGEPVRYDELESDLSGFRIGDLVRTSQGDHYLLADDKPQPLAEFPAAVYDAVTSRTRQLDGDLRAEFGSEGHPGEWPDVLPDPQTTGDLCGVLHPRADGPARVALASDARGSASPDGLSSGRHDVHVEPSGGAYVRAGSDDGSTSGSSYVIDAKGTKHALVGPLVADYIGYGDVEAPIVPSSWLGFFDERVPLSVNAARRVPEDAPAEAAAGEGS